MRWILFMPFMVYQFFKKRNKTSTEAYINSIIIFTIYIFAYCLVLIPQFLIFIFKISSTVSNESELDFNSKIIIYILSISFIILFFILIRKKRLDNLKFNILEYKIANTLTGLIVWLPWSILLFAIIKTCIPDSK